MDAKDQETLHELLKKLSAVRVTLSDEEQTLLDWLIQGSRAEFNADEVKAQSMKFRPEGVKQMGPDEVKAQSMKFGPDQTKVATVTIIYDPELEAYRYS